MASAERTHWRATAQEIGEQHMDDGGARLSADIAPAVVTSSRMLARFTRWYDYRDEEVEFVHRLARWLAANGEW